VAKLVDTTIRLLGQEPLAGRVPTAELLRLAEILDRAGFAYLEVSGGGVFDSAVRRGVESPWERIRSIQARVKTPLGLALRGRFLVGSRPVGGEFARRFVASAAENGIDVFRLHDPLNDVSNLREAAEAIAEAEREFEAGLVYSPGPAGEVDTLVEQARKLPELGAARVVVHDPTGSLGPHGAAELVARIGEASGLPVGVYAQGAGGNAMSAALEAIRSGADLAACAVYPVALAVYRVSGESLAQALAGLGFDTGVDVAALWEASEIVDQHIGDEPVTPLAPRVAVRSAEHGLPAGLVAGIDASLRLQNSGDRLDEVLEELSRIRTEVGSPPLAAPIGQILGSQALIHVLSAQRYLPVVDELRELVSGTYGTPPGPIDPAVKRAVELVTEDVPEEEPVTLEDVREQTQGLASSEEELLLVGLFPEEAESLLRSIRGRGGDDSLESRGIEQSRAERIREIVRVVQESGVAEVTIEESGMRVSVRRHPEAGAAPPPAPAPMGTEQPLLELEPASAPSVTNGFVRVEAPMVGTFYRASQPGAPPFVEEGDAVAAGQTLCILEAMKLMNEIKAELEGVVRKIHVQNAQPVEFGQLLFELEPLPARPLV
jgi:oxaloacetate decarboxylase (Na+ extruding) subunit alpha